MEDLSHDAETHGQSWLNGLAVAESQAETHAERTYWRHERQALQKFLDWFRRNSE